MIENTAARFPFRLRIAAAGLALALSLPFGPARAQPGWFDYLTDLLMSPDQERKVAETEHPKIVEQFGGEYDNKALKAYVQAIVDRIGKASDRPDIAYRVTLLNSPVVNAFALPAGYVYTTRGLLALAGSEAELAGVMAHEIGHVTARHTAQRYSRSAVAQLGVGAANLVDQWFNSSVATTLTGLGMEIWIKGYSQDQELQADQLGVATMTRAGYDPYAMARFLKKLDQAVQLQGQLAGKKPEEGDPLNLFNTHPRTAERVERAIEQAGTAHLDKPRIEREAYLRHVDGMLYGDDPAQGLVQGRVFLHPILNFRFEVPRGFTLINGASEVVAVGPQGASIKFDAAREPYRGRMHAYVTDVWAKQLQLQGVEDLRVDGMEGASAQTQLRAQAGQPVNLRLTAIRFAPDAIYRFQFVAPTQLSGQLWPEFGLVTGSFRRLNEKEAQSMKRHNLRVLEAGASDMVDTLARRMPAGALQVERFRVLNGLQPTDPVTAGQFYKIVVE